MTLRQRWKKTALHNKLLVIIGVIAGIVLPIIFQSMRPGGQSGGPLLHVSPSVREAHLRWETGEFSPRSKQGDDPFAITVRNIGDRNAVNLTFIFALNLERDQFVNTAKNSELFSSRQIEGDAKTLTIPTRYSLSEITWTKINLTEDNVVRRDEIEAHGEVNRQLPVRYKKCSIFVAPYNLTLARCRMASEGEGKRFTQ
jgi:hypothetical protein